MLTLQRDILESVALGDDPDKILNALCLAAEALVPNSVASIMLFKNTLDGLGVRSAPNIPMEAIIAKTIIAMGHGLGLEVIAEGVETVEQLETCLHK